MGEYLPDFSSEIAVAFANSISNAVGDGISEDVLSKGLVTQNGNAARIWDLLHTNLVKAFRNSHIVARPTKRGAWEILPICDKSTGVLFCCMREKNFASISRRDPIKQRRHYLHALIESFNKDLPIFQEKFNILVDENEKEREFIQATISRILGDMGIPQNVVRRHALIMFQTYDGQLISLRCCAVNSKFEIVDSHDWSEFIPAPTSAIVDTVDDSSSVQNNPTQGLKLKSKAKQRLGKKAPVSLPKEQDKNQDKNMDE